MPLAPLTLRDVTARPVLVPLKRPIVSKVGRFDRWLLILIDLYTEEGIVGRSYLEPYLERSARYLVPMILDLAAARRGQRLAPFDDFRQATGSLHLIGREGMTLIAVAGLDMAIWDALAKAAEMPLAVLLGGSLGPVRAYNSNGLWLAAAPQALGDEAVALIAEGAFSALKLRLAPVPASTALARRARSCARGGRRLLAPLRHSRACPTRPFAARLAARGCRRS